MAKKALVDIQSGLEGWDADVNANVAVIRDGPLPIKEFDPIADLPAANLNDRAIAYGNHLQMGWGLYGSDGALWKLIGPQPQVVYVDASFIGSTASVNCTKGQFDTESTHGFTFGNDWKLVFAAAGARHLGTDPGDWTLTVKNKTAATSATWTSIEWAASANVFNGSSSTIELTGDAHDEISALVSGPTVSTCVMSIHLYFLLDIVDSF